MDSITVAVLFGGQSQEYEVSLLSARTLCRHLEKGGYTSFPICITKEGAWQYDPKILGKGQPISFAFGGGVLLPNGGFVQCHAAFPLIHGKTGEDGTLSGFLSFWGIPYVGCDVEASLLSFQKVLSKEAAADLGIPTLPYRVCTKGQEDVFSPYPLEYPLFVKPLRQGSSVGASLVRTPGELKKALSHALLFDKDCLIEPFCSVRELEVAVLDDGIPVVSPPGEITYPTAFYDYRTKYASHAAVPCIPADIPKTLANEMKTYAIRLFDKLGCRHLARVDFFLVGEQLYFNEINTLPGMTEESMYFSLLEAAGIPPQEAVSRLIAKVLHDRDL